MSHQVTAIVPFAQAVGMGLEERMRYATNHQQGRALRVVETESNAPQYAVVLAHHYKVEEHHPQSSGAMELWERYIYSYHRGAFSYKKKKKNHR